MIRSISLKKTISQEKLKLYHLKKQCRLAMKMLLQLHQQHQANHCVLIIGQPESGKSILCASSGKLLYSSQNEYAFEIYLKYFTLFLHIPHEIFLMNETQTQALAWRFIASQLKKLYAYLPTTRCLITLDLHDFLTRSKTSNETRLSQISRALNTLAYKLKAPLEVALFFTKADLIPGFNEFFMHESKEFLEQPWGVTLEEHDTASLSSELDSLIKALNERLLSRIHYELQSESLQLIKTFPLAMETVKHKILEILPEFLNQLTQNRLTQLSQLYFISCRQFRELMEAGHAEFSATKKNHFHKMPHKHFFILKALDHQCEFLPENRTSYINQMTKISFLILCALLFFAFILHTSQQFSQHVALVQNTHQILEAGKSFSKQPTSSLKLNAVTHELEKIDLAWENLKKDQQTLLIGKYIFTRDLQFEAQLQNVYQRIISQQWIPLTNQQLKNYVHSHLTSEPASAYIAFKIYLMLSQPDYSIDAQYIDTHLADLLGTPYASMKLLSGNIQKNLLVVNENDPFVQTTRNYFLSLPAEKLAYILLFSTLDTHHSLNIAETLENHAASLDVDKSFASISELYTAPFFNEIYKKRLPSIAKETLNGNKTLGFHDPIETTKNTLLPKLRDEYVQLYADAWEQAIKHITLIQTQTWADFSSQLNILTSVESPVLSLLNLSQKNTYFSEVEQASPFLTAFNDTLNKNSTPENNALYRSFTFLIKLNDQVKNILNNGDQNAAACQLRAQENAATQENPSNTQQIRYLASQLPEPIQTWWLHMVDTYYALLKQNAIDCQ